MWSGLIGSTSGCLFIILLLVFNLMIGAWSVDYILSWFDADIPRLGDMVIGLFTAEFTVPIAIAGWILKSFGVF